MMRVSAAIVFALVVGGDATYSKRTSGGGSLPTVDLGYAVHQATKNSSGIPTYSFNNIRYAEAPVGDLRFRASIPPQTINRTVNTGENNVICPQAGSAWESTAVPIAFGTPASALLNESHPENMAINISSIPTPAANISEDCLFLDVMVPAEVFDSGGLAKVPVMVWIYGGGYTSGSKSGTTSGLVARAKGGMIYVAMNYRLGVYGWLTGPTLQEDGTANAGFYDQELALKWVQKYISKFGGDPDRVTIMGESAGGGSVMHQITAYGGLKGKRPFHQAIAQSPGNFPVTGNTQQEKLLLTTFKYASLVSGQNISTVQQLRNLSTTDLYNTNYVAQLVAPYATFIYGPAIDGKFVPQLPQELLAHGQFDQSLNVIVGHNLDEGAYFTFPFLFNESDFVANIRTKFPSATPEVVNYITQTLYPPVFDGSLGYTTQFERMALLTSENSFTCTTRFLDKAFKNRTYAYYFVMPPGLHGVDVPYTYFDGDTTTLDQGEPVNATIAYALQDYLTSFTMTGNPNNANQPFFPIYGTNASTQLLGPEGFGTQVVDTTANYRCDWWQKSLFY